jgi:Rrf2 family iron-sulfur cluster assembly transcriptional regulator
MQITRAGEYAVLGATYLARQGVDHTVMVEEICKAESIPKSFLAKIFQNLTRAGLIRSQRGIHGGFKLARKPDKISVLEILEAVEGKIAFQRCLEEPAGCHKQDACSLCDIFTEAQDRVKDIFQNTSLADLTRPKEEVMRRIQQLGRPRTDHASRATSSLVERAPAPLN